MMNYFNFKIESNKADKRLFRRWRFFRRQKLFLKLEIDSLNFELIEKSLSEIQS